MKGTYQSMRANEKSHKGSWVSSAVDKDISWVFPASFSCEVGTVHNSSCNILRAAFLQRGQLSSISAEIAAADANPAVSLMAAGAGSAVMVSSVIFNTPVHATLPELGQLRFSHLHVVGTVV